MYKVWNENFVTNSYVLGPNHQSHQQYMIVTPIGQCADPQQLSCPSKW